MGNWTQEEIDEFVREHQPERVSVWDEVELGKWQNVYGEIVEFQGAYNVAVIYYGTCPFCGNESGVSFIKGTYADPTYPPYCPECGRKLIERRGEDSCES